MKNSVNPVQKELAEFHNYIDGLVNGAWSDLLINRRMGGINPSARSASIYDPVIIKAFRKATEYGRSNSPYPAHGDFFAAEYFERSTKRFLPRQDPSR